MCSSTKPLTVSGIVSLESLILYQVMLAHSGFVSKTNFPQKKTNEVLILKPEPNLKNVPAHMTRPSTAFEGNKHCGQLQPKHV